MASKNVKLDELSKALTSASAEDLRKMQTKINGLLDLSGKNQQVTTTDDWLFDGIVDELVSRGLLHRNAGASLKTKSAYRAYKGKAAQVREVLLKGAPDLGTNQTVLRAFGGRVAYCLAESLTEWTALTPSLMLTLVDRVPAAVDECFPGYLSCGLLGKLVKVAQQA